MTATENNDIPSAIAHEPLHEMIMDTRFEKDLDSNIDTNDDDIDLSTNCTDLDDSMNEAAMGPEKSSSHSNQFFPSATQKKISKKRTAIKATSDTASNLRIKLVEHEIACSQKLNDKKIQIAEDEHKARMMMINTQSLAAEAQISFWLAACASITDFTGKDRAKFDGVAQVVQTSVLAESINQSQHVNLPPDV